jgi:hypothetical protein
VNAQLQADITDLIKQPAFRRFLFHAIQISGIFEASANGTEERTSFRDGRRSLGLDLLREVDAAQPVPNPSGIPMLTLIQVLREEAQSTPQEKPNGRRSGIYNELDDQPAE